MCYFSLPHVLAVFRVTHVSFVRSCSAINCFVTARTRRGPHRLHFRNSLLNFLSPSMQALHVAELVNAPILRGLALFYAEHNLAQLSQQEDFHETILGTTGLAEVSHTSIRRLLTIVGIPRRGKNEETELSLNIL